MKVSTSAYLHDIFHKGLFSDVEVRAFGTSYKLHQLLLMKSPYFRCSIEWNNKIDLLSESIAVNKSCVLNVETDDPLITKQSFELLLKRLYYIEEPRKEKEILSQMIATCGLFQVDDIKVSLDWNLDDVNMNFVIDGLKLDQYYGDDVTQLVNKCKEHLYDNGWQAGYESWRGIKPSLVAEIVNSDNLFVPNEFERIMFAVRMFQDFKAGDDEIDLAITKFRQTFNFFTLTYGQQCVLLDERLCDGKHIFDLSTRAAIITSHVQYYGMFNKTSPVPTDSLQSSQYPEFEKFIYGKEKNGPDSEIILVSSYHRRFVYCGNVWTISLSGYSKSNNLLNFSIKRFPHSYSKPLGERYAKGSSKKISYFDQPLTKTKEPNIPLANEIFETETNFIDRRDFIPTYFKFIFECDNSTQSRKTHSGILWDIPFDNSPSPKVHWHLTLPDYLHEIILKGNLKKSAIKFSFVIVVA
ncbi:unnamed protein product [Ambrosiozyma monospora]|uniref:Unnamed protein product n=1 Tax=Ambrosiozyma monospora TaxID=43982 RepID=A0ACB5SRR4_AMBMO|nr:unnamed protein product [Ambrosiozyma monospora]